MARLWHAVRDNPVAFLALFLALAGTSYGAATLAVNSVGTKQLKANAVTSPKVKNRTLRAVDFGRGQLPRGARGAVGQQGQQGAQGEPGLLGPTGPGGAQGPPGARVHQAGIASAVVIDGTTPTNITILNPTYTQGANESNLFISQAFFTRGQGTTCSTVQGVFVQAKDGDSLLTAVGGPGLVNPTLAAGSIGFRIAPGVATPRTITVTATETCDGGSVTLNSFGIDVLRYGN
jgi:hypothetical protein